MCVDAADLWLHRTVICVLERVPAGCDMVGIRVSTRWSEAMTLCRWRRFVPRREHLLGVDKFRRLWVRVS